MAAQRKTETVKNKKECKVKGAKKKETETARKRIYNKRGYKETWSRKKTGSVK